MIDILLFVFIYVIPVAVGLITGWIVFNVRRNACAGWTLRIGSACISAAMSAVIGLVITIPFSIWLNSIPRGTNDTGTVFAIIGIPIYATLVSLVIGAITGTGIGRSTSQNL